MPTETQLKWDSTSEKLYHTGTKEGILFPMLSAQGSKSWYDHGVAWNGLTGVTETPGGAEANDNYADDIKYISLRGAETFNFTIEAFMAPDEWAACDGQTTVGTAMFGQQSRKPFGFAFKSTVGNDVDKNDYGFDIHIEYNATASPSERAYQTINENPELLTFSWECTSDPVTVVSNNETVMNKPTCNIIVRCTTGNGVLKKNASTGAIEFDETVAAGKNAKLLWDVLRGTNATTGQGATSGTYPTLPDPGVVYEIMNLEVSATKTVADYADVVS